MIDEDQINQPRSVAIVGLGYVGLPLALAFAEQGTKVIGIDIDRSKTDALAGGDSYIERIDSDRIGAVVEQGLFEPSDDIAKCADADAILICLPTPLDRYRAPDLTYVVNTAEALVPNLKRGQLVILESTTYPGTTAEVIKPILERSGYTVGKDIFLGFSPEREDPGNETFSITKIPKVVGADDPTSLAMIQSLYGRIVPEVVTVSSAATAEAVKLTENIFRSVNIALVNELKIVYSRMGIDIWEVIEAAKSKPFGYMPFYPGPGLGGHCIPIDPFYLTWKAREYNLTTRFIELAGEINNQMPDYVVGNLARALDERLKKGLSGARILLVGVAYKKNVGDTRESPALVIWEKLVERGAEVSFHDPYVPEMPSLREHPQLRGVASTPLSEPNLKRVDAALICTDHDVIDYGTLKAHCPLIVDTRNALGNRQVVGESIIRS